MSEQGFNFSKFVEDSKQTLLDPKSYFTGMTTSGGFMDPLMKALLYGIVSGILIFIWATIGLGGVNPMGNMFGGGVGLMALVMTIVWVVVGLFIGGVIMLIISAICGGNTDYETNVRVTAALMVIYPIRSLLGFINGINFTLGMFVGVLISLYSIWMLYHALLNTLKTKPGATKVVIVILVILIAIGFISSLGAASYLQDYSMLLVR